MPMRKPSRHAIKQSNKLYDQWNAALDAAKPLLALGDTDVTDHEALPYATWLNITQRTRFLTAQRTSPRYISKRKPVLRTNTTSKRRQSSMNSRRRPPLLSNRNGRVDSPTPRRSSPTQSIRPKTSTSAPRPTPTLTLARRAYRSVPNLTPPATPCTPPPTSPLWTKPQTTSMLSPSVSQTPSNRQKKHQPRQPNHPRHPNHSPHPANSSHQPAPLTQRQPLPPSLSPHLNRLPQLHHGMCQAPTLPLHFRTFYERVRMAVENSTSANMVDLRSFPLHGEMRVNFCPRCRLLPLRAVLRCRHKACLL